MDTVNRRQAIRTIGLAGGAAISGAALTACAPSANPGANIQKSGQRVADAKEFPAVGSFKDLEVAGTPVILVRVSRPQDGGASVGEVHLAAFSRQCTHLGCVVNDPVKDVIGCACHGSVFKLETGEVVNGPASRPLPRIKLEARQDVIYAVP